MKKIVSILLIPLFVINLYGAVDYSEMSTEELIVIMGYVEKKNQEKFKKELKNRVPTMTAEEKSKYEKNLKEMQKK